jgi:hypothetical protein
MLTLDQMIRATFSLRNKVLPTASWEITKTGFGPGKDFGDSFSFTARFSAFTDPRMGYYDAVIAFYKVGWSATKDTEHPQGYEVLPGFTLYLERPSMSKHRAAVSCLCKDYYYTWWWYDYENQALDGEKFPKYMRKDGYDVSDPKRPRQRNSVEAPGLCKHILRLAQGLKQRGFLIN